jgi:hypothetical protein
MTYKNVLRGIYLTVGLIGAIGALSSWDILNKNRKAQESGLELKTGVRNVEAVGSLALSGIVSLGSLAGFINTYRRNN